MNPFRKTFAPFRRAVVLSVLCALQVTVASAGWRLAQTPGASSGWQTFRSDEGKFSVLLPTPPVYKAQKLSFGSIELTQHQYTADGGALGSFDVVYMDVPGGFDADQRMDNAINTVERSRARGSFRTISKTTIEHKGCGGRALVMRHAQGGDAETRIFASGQRTYMLMSDGRNTAAARSARKRFFDSFEVEGGCVEDVVTDTPSGDKTSVVAGVADAATGWRTISSKVDGFSVLMPVEATLSERMNQSGPLSIRNNLYESIGEEGQYYVLINGDFPEGILTNPEIAPVFLEKLIPRLEQTMGLSLKFVRDIRLGQQAGREYTVDTGTATGLGHLFIASTRFYFFIATSSSAENRNRFFSSVKLID